MSETGGVGARLATTGEVLKIWDTTNFSPVHHFTATLPPVGGVAAGLTSNSWSADTSCVASVIKGRDQIVLTYGKGARYTSQELGTPGVERPSLVRFPRTNQKQVILAAGSNLHIYDIARSKVKKSFSLRSAISALAVNYCDAYLAAGCVDGSLVLCTVATNQTSAPLLAPKCGGQRLTSVQYSPVKHSFLGTSCESGIVSFWDVNATKNLFNVSPHCAPCTQLIFSPINDTLALSVGLDKKLVCCDTKTKKVILSIECENPLTAADFDLDGVTMAVGTSRGKVLVYDLRSPKCPSRVLQAHNSAVSSLVYQHRVDVGAVSQVMSTVKQQNKMTGGRSKLARQEKSQSSLVTVQEEAKENTGPLLEGVSPAPVGRKDSLSSQLFSPLRDTDISFPGSTVGGTQEKPTSRRVSEVRLSTDGLFSPLREVNSPNNSTNSMQLSLNKKSAVNSFSTPIMSPLSSIQEEGGSHTTPPASPLTRDLHTDKLSLDKLTEFVKRASSGERSPEFIGQRADHVLPVSGFKPATRLRFSATKEDRLVRDGVGEEEEVMMPSIVKPDMSAANNDDFTSVLTAFPGVVLGQSSSSQDTISSAANRIADKLMSSDGPSPTSADPGAASFQRNYISGVVSEAMGDWCEGMERRLWSLQYSLLRQLQQHQEETKSMMAEVSGVTQMREEVELLRKENRELRKFFGNVGHENRDQ